MGWQCPKTCDTCGQCLDGDGRCSTTWSNMCSNQNILQKCPLTCGVCTAATPSPTPVPTPSPTTVTTPSPTPVPTPSPTPVTTPSPTPVPTPSPTPEEECVDSHSRCPQWANQCDRMLRKWQCPKTCDTCGQCLDGDARCSTTWSA